MKNLYVKRTALLLVVLGSLASVVYGQDGVKSIKLADAIVLALRQNRAVQLAQLDEKVALADYKKTDAIHLPQIDVSYSAMTTNDPLAAFGFKLSQRSISGADFNPDLLNHPAATPNFNARLNVLQPLVNMDMVYQRKAALKQTELYRYQTQRTGEYVTFSVQKVGLQLQLAYDAEAVVKEGLQTARSIKTSAENHFQQGLLQKSDVLNAQVQVSMAESNLVKAQSTIQNVSDQLSLLTGQPLGVVYKLDSQINDQSNGRVLPDSATLIPATRADFMAMQKAVDASQLMIRSTEMSTLPKLNAFGSYQINDKRFASTGASAYMAGIQLSWTVFAGFRTKNTLASQKLSSEKLTQQLAQQKEQAQLELDKTYRDLADARFEVRKQTESVQQAEEALRILQNRFEQGLVSTTDLLMAQSQLSQQRLGLAQAGFNLNITRAYIEFLTAINQ